MFKETLAPQTAQTLEILKTATPTKDFYLAGGTGLALQLGHRVSEDLDWFTAEEFQPLLLLGQIKEELPDLKTEKVSQSWGTLKFFHRETMVSFFTYPYPLLKELITFENYQLAQIIDIAAMKITSVADRGIKKDFIDLYFICQQVDFADLFNSFLKKYEAVNFEPYHYLKALAYFEEAEDSPSPYMLKPVDWEEIKEFFRGKITNYSMPAS